MALLLKEDIQEVYYLSEVYENKVSVLKALTSSCCFEFDSATEKKWHG